VFYIKKLFGLEEGVGFSSPKYLDNVNGKPSIDAK